MNKSVTITNKCRIGSTEGAVKFSTRSGKREFFNIPHSQIMGRKVSEVRVNNIHSEPATEYIITNKHYDRIKVYLEKMKDHDIILPK